MKGNQTLDRDSVIFLEQLFMNTKKAERKFVQVSLPAAFAEALRADAEGHDRSMAAQIEHWARIGKAIETVAPGNSINIVKTAKEPSDILSALAAFVAAPNVNALRSQYNSSGVVNYGSDPAHPGVVFQHNPDGTVVRGSFDAKGDFSPFPSPQPVSKRTRNDNQQHSKQRTKPIGHPAAKKENREPHREVAIA